MSSFNVFKKCLIKPNQSILSLTSITYIKDACSGFRKTTRFSLSSSSICALNLIECELLQELRRMLVGYRIRKNVLNSDKAQKFSNDNAFRIR